MFCLEDNAQNLYFPVGSFLEQDADIDQVLVEAK